MYLLCLQGVLAHACRGAVVTEVCELCHVGKPIHSRDGLALCDECADGWDYQASLTPAERRDEEAAIAAYVDESRDWA
jgi:hypothetical protein